MLKTEKTIGEVPEATARIARAAFAKGNIYMWLRDELGQIYADEDFADLFSNRGQPGGRAWRLALVCVRQFLEDLTDRQAAEAVRGRIDWKYALGLEFEEFGFDFSVLSEYKREVCLGRIRTKTARQIIKPNQRKGMAKGKKSAEN